MLEKSGTIQLTPDDLKKLGRGEVSDRVKQTWGFTLWELQDVVNNSDYIIIANNNID